MRLGVALDDPPPGWRVANPDAAKAVTAALLAGEPVDLAIEAAEADCDWLARRQLCPARGSGERREHRVHLVVTDRVDCRRRRRPSSSIPPLSRVGIGCERGASADEVRALVMQCLAQANLSPLAVAGIFSIALKAAEPAIHAVAQELGVPARFFPAAVLLAETPRLSERSDIVFRETGCWGVAEGAALAAAGPEAALTLPKQRSARATCAIARSPRIIDATSCGRPARPARRRRHRARRCRRAHGRGRGRHPRRRRSRRLSPLSRPARDRSPPARRCMPSISARKKRACAPPSALAAEGAAWR